MRHPVNRGIVTNWDDMERLWDYVLTKGLRVNPWEHGIILTEPPLNPRSNRERMGQVMFETFSVAACHVAIPSVLSLYASGRTTGLIVESGDGVTQIVPVFEGFAIARGIQRIDVAGRDVTDLLAGPALFWNVRRAG